MQALVEGSKRRFESGLTADLRNSYGLRKAGNAQSDEDFVATEVRCAVASGIVEQDDIRDYVTASWLVGCPITQFWPAALTLLANPNYARSYCAQRLLAVAKAAQGNDHD